MALTVVIGEQKYILAEGTASLRATIAGYSREKLYV